MNEHEFSLQPNIQFSWYDPVTRQHHTPTLRPPVAFGRVFQAMPSEIQGQSVSRMVLNDDQASRYHALITWEQGSWLITDQNSANGLWINGERCPHARLTIGSTVQIGHHQIQIVSLYPTPVSPSTPDPSTPDPSPTQPPPTVPDTPTIEPPDYAADLANHSTPEQSTHLPETHSLPLSPHSSPTLPPPTAHASPPAPRDTVIPFDPTTGLPQIGGRSSTGSGFPPDRFLHTEHVSLADLQQTGWFDPATDQVTYAALGAGLGSYIWVDYLRICGVPAADMVAIGTQQQPYGKYKQLCLNSQIPLHERLRSNSDSCPDNIWGWPSYALREAWRDSCNGRPDRALRYLWQVFAEPTLAETYTPRSGNVFASIDREAARIGWPEIYRYGSIRAIRKTDDGCYAIAYSQGRGHYRFLVAKYVHLATGYPAIRFLPHLQDYRDRTQDMRSVVNAYEAHDHVYEQLAAQGGTVLLQGRGIVASRILQRINEVRRTSGQPIEVIHLMRSQIRPQDGHRYGWARRPVKHHWEFQPFNWPKACWGGDLRDTLEQADYKLRSQLLRTWGGTTTADRRDWQRIVRQGLRDKWYQIRFGTVEQVTQENQQLQIIYSERESGVSICTADFIIDATGLDAAVTESPLLEDLVQRYQLPLLDNGRFVVSNEFELVNMRSTPDAASSPSAGRMYAAGVITLGGPYAAVDSFLGLQYAALRSVDNLGAIAAPGLRRLNGWNSFSQWLKWARNQSP